VNLSGIMRSVEEAYRKKEVPTLKVGDTVKVQVRIKEGDSGASKKGAKESEKGGEGERLQAFTGTIIAITGKNISRSITVRHVSMGIGVERIFPMHAPAVASIEVLSHHQTRRSKLYYLRGRSKRMSRLVEQREVETKPQA